MVSLAAVGESDNRDSVEAGREATRAALDRLGGQADALLVFATAGHDQAALLATIRSGSGPAVISGCSGSGVISGGRSRETTHSVAVLAVRSSALSFTSLLERGLAADAEGIGRAMGERARAADARALFLFPDGLTGNLSALLRGIAATAPEELLVFGGAAGELLQFTHTFQYAAEGPASDAVAGLLVGGDVTFDVAISHGCKLLSIEHVVTRATGGTVHELDGRPAWEVMREYIDAPRDTLSSEDVSYLSLAQRDPETGSEVIRVPLGHDRATGALFFPGELRQGTSVTMARREVEEVIERAVQSAAELAARAAGRDPLFVLHADCTGRGRVLLGDAVSDRLLRPVQRAFPTTAPWMGFHAYGEIAPLGRHARYHNYTMALCAAYAGG